MSIVTKPSTRASDPTKPNTGSVIRTMRKPVTTDWNDQAIPGKVNNGVFRNAGTVEIHIRFNNQAAGQYWTLLPSEQTPAIKLGQDRTMLHYRSAAGTSVLECLLWSD